MFYILLLLLSLLASSAICNPNESYGFESVMPLQVPLMAYSDEFFLLIVQ